MTYPHLLKLTLVSSLAALACSSSDQSPGVVAGPLSALHAELDAENGGRIEDALGREVLLRGVNVNSLGEYWAYDPNIGTVLPFGEEDAEAIAGIGWNVVRLILSWSRVEPNPGEYDEAYLDEAEAVVRLLESREVYTIIDLHQDAWDESLAARDDDNCPEGTTPAFGWDGAPHWATLDNDASRCITDGPATGRREFSPAVIQAFLSFWNDEEGPGGVGIQARYHAMLSHVAARFSRYDAVAGYDPMNEPNAFSEEILAIAAPGLDLEDQTDALSSFYQRALGAIREGEQSADSPARLMLFEPSNDWAFVPTLAVRPVFDHDGQVVYSPHIYQGGITGGDLEEADFQLARDDAAMYGGVPVLTGEWGTSPARAIDPADDYFERHEALQDEYRYGAALWQWSSACGDPHYAHDPPVGDVSDDPSVWGFYDLECPSNQTLGFREDFASVLRRPLLRAAPGPIDSVMWDYEAGVFSAEGSAATEGQVLSLFVHEEVDAAAFSATGLANVEIVRALGPGQIWSAEATAKNWELRVTF
jgi:endoglycosylceramidase